MQQHFHVINYSKYLPFCYIETQNLTAIVDKDHGNCFVMDLNRTVVQPPRSFYDLLVKAQVCIYHCLVTCYVKLHNQQIADFANYNGRDREGSETDE